MSQYNYYQLNGQSLKMIKQLDFENQESNVYKIKVNKTLRFNKRAQGSAVKVLNTVKKNNCQTHSGSEYISNKDDFNLLCPNGHKISKSTHELSRNKEAVSVDCKQCKYNSHEDDFEGYGFETLEKDGGIYNIKCPHCKSTWRVTGTYAFSSTNQNLRTHVATCKTNFGRKPIKSSKQNLQSPKEKKMYRQKLLEKRGYTLLDEKDITAALLSKIKMMCEDGHIQDKSFKDIQRATTSCKKCRLETNKIDWVQRVADKGCTLDPKSVKGKRNICNKTSSVVSWVESNKGRMVDPKFEYQSIYQLVDYFCSFNHLNTHSIQHLTRYEYLPCTHCKRTSSYGEMGVEKYLKHHKIQFTTQHNPVTLNRLRYDFKLVNHQVIIEFDGQQHFDAKSFFFFNKSSDGFERQRQRDLVKNQFCKNNGILLIRIHHSWITNLYRLDNELLDCIKDISGTQIITIPRNHTDYNWVHQPPKKEFMKWYMKDFKDLEDGDDQVGQLIDYDEDVYEDEDEEEDTDEDLEEFEDGEEDEHEEDDEQLEDYDEQLKDYDQDGELEENEDYDGYEYHYHDEQLEDDQYGEVEEEYEDYDEEYDETTMPFTDVATPPITDAAIPSVSRPRLTFNPEDFESSDDDYEDKNKVPQSFLDRIADGTWKLKYKKLGFSSNDDGSVNDAATPPVTDAATPPVTNVATTPVTDAAIPPVSRPRRNITFNLEDC
ncbi:hypothetical protein DFA_09152 [Cavenderia fasciculata]|uniref:Uncharacterized protein n=1 Tax=Cavenderia fasciculata TaxID=261658 RepID=F4Q6U5_CACFS|nr:uncharacterized protein DFA_09152 [Cavenderia fasciculata]EGG16127.1 hypothetical protein DFA_09152 [Cavenderia fasciculata]|eukprot:XP_004352580.1 hypothetical protein DFA_09152 [Cavenderia fasciculata]